MTSMEHAHDVDVDWVVSNNNAYLMAMGSGSRIEIHAADAEKESWTQLEMTASAGSSDIVLQEATGWEIGDRIAIASTTIDFEQAEEFTVLGISTDGKTITLGDGDGNPAVLAHEHLGITTEHDNGQSGEDHRDWTVEMRAEVALLSRNVTIQGDEDSVEDGIGGHTMVMGGAEQHISGAEFYRMGQVDIIGKYPIHWHMLGSSEGQYVQNSSVHHTYQKGSTVHGTSDIRYEDNVVFEHVGHGLFFEDGSENNNQIYGNLIFGTRESLTGEPIPTDGEHASSFWIENPNNAFIGNHAAGSESNGFWIFEGLLHGLSARIPVGEAGQLHDLVFIGNTGHSTSGSQGASGTDKILGIDGRLTPDLDFRQATLSGEFGTIEGFTAYAGPVWNLTHEMTFSNSSFTDVRFFARHENYIEDTVFDGATVILYRDGGNQYEDVLAVDGTRFIYLASDHVNGPNGFNNAIFDESSVTQFGGGLHEGAINQQVGVDIDGSVTGIVGGFMTPGTAFDAAPGAVTVEGVGGLVSQYTIASTEVTALGIDGIVRVLRSDGESLADIPSSKDFRVLGDDNEDRSKANYEFYTTSGMSRDLAYLIDFADAPESLILNLANARDRESVTYEVQNITAIGDVTGGIAVSTLTELVNSDQTAYLHAGESLFIRIVADRVEVQDDRPVADVAAEYRAFGKIEIAGLVEGTNADAGTRQISQALLDAIDIMPERDVLPAPEVREPDFDRNDSYIAYDVTMTEGTPSTVPTAAKASFELNYDVASRTVSIAGEFSGLGTDIKLVHLHGADGSVVQGFEIQTEDGRSGTFSQSFQLSAEDAADFLAGDTYVNLHTEEPRGAGDLQAMVEVFAAGDFVLDRHDSTSFTTEVTDNFARWSEAEVWGTAGTPGADDIVVIGKGQSVVLDQSVTVKGIIVNGGELIIEDDADLTLDLATDYLLVVNGGLFQAGTEDDALDTEFTLTLEGDDPGFDLEVGRILMGMTPNTVFAQAASPANVTGRYFVDLDGTNTLTAEDDFVANATVTLLRDAVAIATTTTDGAGRYKFSDVATGDGYRVAFEDPQESAGLPLDYITDRVGHDPQIDSDVIWSNRSGEGTTVRFSVPEGAPVSGMNAGLRGDYVPPEPPEGETGISGRYFLDLDGSGQYSAGDGDVAGAQVSLLLNGSVVAQVTTETDGTYAFADIAASDGYRVVFQAPQDAMGYDIPYITERIGSDPATDSDVIWTNGRGEGTTRKVSVEAGTRLDGMDAGLRGADSYPDPTSTPTDGKASVSGRYYIDRDLGEPFSEVDDVVANATVQLLLEGKVVAEAITDSDGRYTFENLQNAEGYRLAFQNAFDVTGEDMSFIFNTGSSEGSDILWTNTAGSGYTHKFDLSDDAALDGLDAGLAGVVVIETDIFFF